MGGRRRQWQTKKESRSQVVIDILTLCLNCSTAPLRWLDVALDRVTEYRKNWEFTIQNPTNEVNDDGSGCIEFPEFCV